MSDRLPPHAEIAEAALLGCVLLASSMGEMDRAEEVLAKIAETGPVEMFYDLRNREIAKVLLNIRAEGRPAGDPATLMQRVKDSGLEQQVGGLSYISELPEKTGGVGLWPEYLKTVFDKFVARKALQAQDAWRTWAQSGDLTESKMAAMQRDMDDLRALAARNLKLAPKDVARCTDMPEKIWNLWTGKENIEPGLDMPFEFPMKFRPSEVTLMTGDNGSGKSSMLSQVALCLARQGWKIFMASLEVPPEVTYWILLRQLLGQRGPSSEDEAARQAEFAQAMSWLKERVLLYDFTGITNWRGLLDIFYWLRSEEKVDCFIVDSVMRIGIPDDDFAEQGVAAARFADFAVKQGAHVFLVIHENKGDGGVKVKIRGSKQWSDNAHNVCSMLRNERKAEKLAEIKAQIKSHEIEESEGKALLGSEKFRKEWDSKFRLHKQRWPGSQQNGSRHLYFYHPALQFLEQWDSAPVRYL